MNEPEDKGTSPEPPAKPEPAGVWLPPRLREKLEQPSSGEEFDFLKRKSSPVGTIITVVVIAAVVAGAWWIFQKDQNNKREAAAAKAAKERAVVVADSLARVQFADSLAAVVRADSIAFAALPRWQQRKILAERAKLAAAAQGSASPNPAVAGGPSGGTPSASGGATAGAGDAAESPAGATQAPEEVGPFGIDAGQFLDEARAGEIAAELKEKTGLAAAVVPMGEGEEISYHVVLGSYPRRATAESKAGSLLAKGSVIQAEVVPLPKPQ